MQTLKELWQAWKRLARKIGTFQSRVLLTVLYVVLILPFGLATRWFADPLRIKRRPNSWLDHDNSDPSSLEWARRQG